MGMYDDTPRHSFDLAGYQTRSRVTYHDIEVNDNLVYPMLGLANEVGELLGKYKKLHRDAGGEITPEVVEAMKGELGDVLWYFTQIATNLGLTLPEIAEANLEKVLRRKREGTIHGNGDNR